MRGSVVLIVAAFGCSACGSLLETDLPPSANYVLAPAPAAADSSAARSDADLSIGRPDLSPGLDTERIAVLKGRQLDYYRGAQWGGRATEVVQTMLVDSFEDQRLFRSVTAEQSRISSDYVLDVTVRDFQAEYAGDTAPTAHVTILGRLVRVADRQLVDTFAATAQNRAADNRMSAVAAAFEAAAQKVALELAQKTAATIAGDQAKLRAASDAEKSRR
ncbi:MAG TPA: ABC-type transport auxiliary lipoprotein family protein [Steroidobacteraceae bacterium]|nr:ABC-type transport auxiliary lipoprotein family protein [Steroidobacteraceae bacterium]